MATDNIGETGTRSIRLNGCRIDELPIAEAAAAAEQLPEAEKTQLESEAENIRARYPQHTPEYLESRIREAAENVDRMTNAIADQQAMISDYKGHISLCRHRDKEIENLDEVLREGHIDQDYYDSRVRGLKRQFPEYDVGRMEQQIETCLESIERCEKVREQEHESIAELREVLALVQQRDRELARIGA